MSKLKKEHIVTCGINAQKPLKSIRRKYITIFRILKNIKFELKLQIFLFRIILKSITEKNHSISGCVYIYTQIHRYTHIHMPTLNW